MDEDLFLIYGKVLPNLTTLLGIGMAFFGDANITGGIIAGISEAVRVLVRDNFYFKEIENGFKDYHEEINKNARLLKKLTEQIKNNSLENKL